MFSRYWTEIFVTGVLPLVALVYLNYGIYVEIRNSKKFRQNPEMKSPPPRNVRKCTTRLRISSTLNMNNLSKNHLKVRATSASSFELSRSVLEKGSNFLTVTLKLKKIAEDLLIY
jgi:hypothetical protein